MNNQREQIPVQLPSLSQPTPDEIKRILSESNNPFKILGVNPADEDAEIKKTYRRLALITHPDKNTNRTQEATTAFRKVEEAYKKIETSQKRRRWAKKYQLSSQTHSKTTGTQGFALLCKDKYEIMEHIALIVEYINENAGKCCRVGYGRANVFTKAIDMDLPYFQEIFTALLQYNRNQALGSALTADDIFYEQNPFFLLIYNQHLLINNHQQTEKNQIFIEKFTILQTLLGKDVSEKLLEEAVQQASQQLKSELFLSQTQNIFSALSSSHLKSAADIVQQLLQNHEATLRSNSFAGYGYDGRAFSRRSYMTSPAFHTHNPYGFYAPPSSSIGFSFPTYVQGPAEPSMSQSSTRKRKHPADTKTPSSMPTHSGYGQCAFYPNHIPFNTLLPTNSGTQNIYSDNNPPPNVINLLIRQQTQEALEILSKSLAINSLIQNMQQDLLSQQLLAPVAGADPRNLQVPSIDRLNHGQTGQMTTVPASSHEVGSTLSDSPEFQDQTVRPR